MATPTTAEAVTPERMEDESGGCPNCGNPPHDGEYVAAVALKGERI